jgi:NTP pyrophosphatase (non-canonical NTP hydrolase)
VELTDLIKQCSEDSKRWFPDERAQSLANQVLCLAGEVGEIANIVKKLVRGSLTMNEGLRIELATEIIDVAVYLFNIMGSKTFEGIDWEDLWKQKCAFNEARFGSPRLPKQVLAEAGVEVGDVRQSWQQEGDFAS